MTSSSAASLAFVMGAQTSGDANSVQAASWGTVLLVIPLL